MNMMERLLRNVGRSWDKLPKELPVLYVKRGTGKHPFMSVDGNQLHLHTEPYRQDLPIKQSIVLEELTLQDLVDTLEAMGYEASITNDAYKKKVDKRKAFTLTGLRNKPITDGHTLSTFTSKLWETLYPIARLLEETDQDIDRAIQEMLVTTSRGRWLEYWASFFGIRRVLNESDETLRKRILMTLINVKTNNVVIQDMLSHAVQGNVRIKDHSPARFMVETQPSYMDEASVIRSLIDSIKGAGIAYFFYYLDMDDEDYRAHLEDKNEAEGGYRNIDKRSGTVILPHEQESTFGYTPLKNHPKFRTNSSKLVTGEQVMDMPIRLHDRPDIHSIVMEGEGTKEVYEDRLHHKGKGMYRLNSTLTNSTSEVLFAKYHETDVTISGELSRRIEDRLDVLASEVLNGEVVSAGHQEYVPFRRTAVSAFRLGGTKLASLTRITPYLVRSTDELAHFGLESHSSEVYDLLTDSVAVTAHTAHEDLLTQVAEDVGDGFETGLEEPTFRIRKTTDDDFLTGDTLNGEQLIAPYEERLDSAITGLQGEVEDTYVFNRIIPVPKDDFELNDGILNNPTHTLYGKEEVGDIISVISVNCAEIFPHTNELVASDMYSTFEENFEAPSTKGRNGFRTHYTKLVTGSKLSVRDTRMAGSFSMVMERNGQVVQSM